MNKFNIKIADENKQQSDSSKISLYKYTREWLEYKYVGENFNERFEIYISNNNDTLGFQKLIFKNDVLDTTQSTFYKLNTEFLKDNTVRGSLELFSETDHSIKSKLKEREIELNLLQHFENKKDILVFKSKNNNSVDFEFKHQSDTLIGIVIDKRQYDTIVNGESMIRMTTGMLPVDNKRQTNNPFINLFILN